MGFILFKIDVFNFDTSYVLVIGVIRLSLFQEKTQEGKNDANKFKVLGLNSMGWW